MNSLRSIRLGLGVAALVGGLAPSLSLAQNPPALEPPSTTQSSDPTPIPVPTPTPTILEPIPPIDSPPVDGPVVADNSLPSIPALPEPDSRPIRPAAEGPLHEAFLSPAKDRAPDYVDKAPPNPINERPGVDPPSDKAVWIPGYWEWNGGQEGLCLDHRHLAGSALPAGSG